MSFARPLGEAQHLRGFREAKPPEIAQLYQFSLLRVMRGEAVERFVDGEHFVVGCRGGDLDFIYVEAGSARAAANRALAPRGFHEDATHCFGGGAEEMRTIRKAGLAIFIDEPQPRLVDERRGLKGLSGQFARHLRASEFAQLPINKREQFVGGLGVAVLNGIEKARNVTHAGYH